MSLLVRDVEAVEYPTKEDLIGRLVDTEALIQELRDGGGDLLVDGWSAKLKGHLDDDLLRRFRESRLLILWQCAEAAAAIGRACWQCTGVGVQQRYGRWFCSDCGSHPHLEEIVTLKERYLHLGKCLAAMEEQPDPKRRLIYAGLTQRYHAAREALLAAVQLPEVA